MNDPLATHRIKHEPYYRSVADEVALFELAHQLRIPMMLKGPTGCGKTRFVEYMAWRLGMPLISVACNDDLTASDLVGRWLLNQDGTYWQDGPLAMAVRHGAICYLDEVVEARADTTVVIHPLADSRRVLSIDKINEQLVAHQDFHLIVSFNPGYQNITKDMKISTRQRFAGIEFGFPQADVETEIVVHESGLGWSLAHKVVAFGERTRHLKGHGLEEGASTRMLIHAASLIAKGLEPYAACHMAVVLPIADDPDMVEALNLAISASF